MEAAEKAERRAGYPLILGLIVLSLGIVVGGTFYYRHYEQQFRAGIELQLSAVAELKAGELAQYRKERLGDAAIFLNNDGFSALVKRFLTHPEDTDAQRQIQEWANKFVATDQYDHARLLDTQGATRLSSPVGLPPVTFVAQRIPQALGSDQVTFRDLHLNENDHRVYLNILVPIFEEHDIRRPLGVFYLRIDAKKYLYPSMQRWPTPSQTAEMLLVRREGNDALYLNDVRYRTNAALNLRIPLEQTNVPAVRAALGQTGIMQGTDYRGVPVIAAVRAVNNSPWFLVAKIDTAEVYAPLRERLWLIILLVGILLLGAGAGAGAIWRRRRVQFYKERSKVAEALRESQALYLSLVEQLPVGVFRKNREGRYVFVNPWFCRLKGMKAEAFLGKMPEEVADSDVAKSDATGRAVKYAAAGGGHHEQIMQTGKPIELDEEYTNVDGRKHFVHAIKIPVIDPDGKVIGSQGILFDVTELKQAGEVVRQTEERLARVMTQTRCILNFGQVEGPPGWRERALLPETPFHWDFPVQNQEAAQKVVPLELAFGERYQQAWTRSRDRADHAQMNWNSGNAFLNDLPFYRNEFRCVDKHGMGHWMQQFVTVQKLTENRWQVFGITTDISDLKRIETELRESQALYLSLVDQMPAGVFRKDAEGRYVFVNAPFCRLKDMPQEQFLGKTALELELTDVELKAKGADHHALIMQKGNQIEADEVYTRADGETRNYHVVKSPVFDAAGKIVGTQGVLFDITERKRVEKLLAEHTAELAKERRFLRTLVDALPDLVFAKDAQSRFIMVNTACADQLGAGLAEEVLGKTDADFVPPELASQYLADEQALMQSGQSMTKEEPVLRRKTEEMFQSLTTKVPLKNDTGAVVGLIGIARDITVQKRQEKELREKNSELERFTYTVSHDLKSPLVTVKTFLGFLEQDLARPDLERVKQDVTYIRTAADKMGLLLDELLNLARVGRKENPTVRVTFRELAQETIGLIAGRISASGVEVQVADAAVTLEGDRPRLLEIWQNLVENACKFMGNQPKPRVEIGVEQRGPETVFFVRDNGSGIEPRYQAKVFGLFEKLDPKGEGTGMGLALVKRIVELYGGRIWVESAGPGQGANFLFTLPGAVILEPKKSP